MAIQLGVALVVMSGLPVIGSWFHRVQRTLENRDYIKHFED